MPAAPRPPRDRPRQLVTIAFKHIAQRGFEGLRTHDVAAEARINNATLHYYFPTKEDLIRGVVNFMIEEFSRTLLPAAAPRRGADAWEELEQELVDARERTARTPAQMVVYTELLLRSLRDPSMVDVFRQFDRSWRGHLQGIIERGVRAGTFQKGSNPEAEATLLMLQMKGMALQMLAQRGRHLDDVVFDRFFEQIRLGLSGGPAKAARRRNPKRMKEEQING